jgi:hypothetical protein
MDSRTLYAFSDEIQKIAGFKDKVLDPSVLLPAVGAAVFGVAQYMANRAPKGEKSTQQKAFEKAERSVDYDEAQRKKEGKKPGFLSETSRITAKPMRELADLAAKHPVKAAIPTAAVGAMAGRTIARMMK